MDPCGGPVVHPGFAGASPGLVQRSESFTTHGTQGTTTAGVFHWVPGYPNAGNTEVLIQESANGSTASATIVQASSPGKTFLAANSRAVRCIAACLRVTFPGAESARSGRVHFGHTTGGLIDLGNSISPDGTAQALTNFTRTPPEAIEIVWKPSAADQDFCDPSESASAPIRDRRSALTVAFAGLPVSVGLTFHMTAVYEWLPTIGLGIASDINQVGSANSLDDVLRWVGQTGFKYVRQMGMSPGQPGPDLRSVATNLAGVYGLMAARPRRNVPRIEL
jgi:hypothetical protein